MRWSRVYLGLSIVSLLVAVGMGAAKKHCSHRHNLCTLQRSVPTAQPEPYSIAYSAMRERDFATMASQADILIAGDYPEIGHALRAYALRGQGRYEEAIEHYTSVLVLDSSGVSDALRSDCYVGRAACFNALEETERAREDIQAAKELTKALVRSENDKGAHYQMACIYSIESQVNDGTSVSIAHGWACAQLRLAIKKGFNSWDHMHADLDLDPLRNSPRYKELFQQ